MRDHQGKRILSLGLALCLSLALLALPAGAAGEGEAVPALSPSHLRFIQGVPGGAFLPDGKLTRAQAAQMVHRLLADPDGGTLPAAFTDVEAGEWYAAPVNALAAWGLFGEGDRFRPADVMTRAEFVALLTRLRPDAEGTASFSDVPPDHWACRQIGAAASLGWIDGYPDGRFGPEDGLSRAEACAILCRVTGRTGDADRARTILTLGLFSDVPPDHWAGTAIAEAAVAHTPSGNTPERWLEVDGSKMTLVPGFHEDGARLYYVDRNGRQVTGRTLGPTPCGRTAASSA